MKTRILVFLVLALTSVVSQAGYSVAWWGIEDSIAHRCAEVTPAGGYVRWVDEVYCTSTFGAHYSYWQIEDSIAYKCAEVTPQKGYVRWVDDTYCTQQ